MPFRPTIMGTHGMVATEHYLSALIGVQILQQGGNAVDAAVAAIFAEGVLNPHMHTIGGEVPMLIAMADKGPAGAQRSQADWSYQVSAINGNTVAPQRATIKWFASQQLSLIPGEGLLAAGVPAAFDALITALDRFGTLTLAEVLEPVLALASQGFPMHHGLRGPSDYLSWSIWHNVKKFQEDWPTSGQLYLPQGRLPEVGDIFCNGDLAHTFERLLHAERAGSSQVRAAGLTAAVEGRIPYEVRRALQAKGHQIATQPDWIEGYIVGVQVDAERGVVYGGADPRGELTSLLPAYAIGW